MLSAVDPVVPGICSLIAWRRTFLRLDDKNSGETKYSPETVARRIPTDLNDAPCSSEKIAQFKDDT